MRAGTAEGRGEGKAARGELPGAREAAELQWSEFRGWRGRHRGDGKLRSGLRVRVGNKTEFCC